MKIRLIVVKKALKVVLQLLLLEWGYVKAHRRISDIVRYCYVPETRLSPFTISKLWHDPKLQSE